MEFSRRIANLQASPTVALNAKAKKLAASGTKVFNFAVGEPDLPTPKLIVDACIQSLQAGNTRYGPPGGSESLRSQIKTKLLEDNGLEFEVDQIVCGVGAKEIIFHLCLALLNEDDEVLLPAPYWVSYPTQIAATGAKAVVVPFDAEALEIDTASIKNRISDRTKLIILNTPNNPAGYVLSDVQLKELGEALKSSGCYILSDEIYEYLSYDAPHISLLRMFPELKDRFILVNGLSKGFAMTGWRVGYCAAPTPIAKLVKTLQSQSSTCLPPFIEDAAVVALKNRSVIRQTLSEAMLAKRKLVERELTAIAGIRWVRCAGAFYAFIDLRDILRRSTKLTESTSLAFGEFLLEEHHVAMVPGEAFGAPGFIRLSYAASEQDLMAGLQNFATALESIK